MPPKGSDERAVITFDFGPALDAGETLTEIISAVVRVNSGEDESPQSIVHVPAQMSQDNKRVLIGMWNGIPNVSYLLRVACDTSNQNKRVGITALLEISP